jgi:hypothetical protein
MEDIKKRVWKEWKQIQEKGLWEDREEWRRLCYKRERVDIQENVEGFVTG